MKSKTGDLVFVHAYKHNGKLYRSWEKVSIFEETENYIILINEEVLITEVTGRKWKTNEPAIWFFFKEDWYNIICMFKERGINYYCNLASPYIFEEGTVKYIDYDLDFKVFNDFSYKILDLKEFNRNRITWNYSRDIIEKVWKSVDEIKEKIKTKQKPFVHEYVNDIWNKYLELKNKD
ncbi:DUF402 domain-containing protein [Spiroplasma cantharicola]|uniref:Uncharacterized protein associated with RNAses G and E n=1 Tax=Spiroplasma cantharicola TaxID=362837 RepID=A0A0M3SJ41_9MOLU|nr:DUF402 domain-containing protein [Spiroplasma cantharicola]ALD66084.1 uncharacterized protein associated with RNAses G and E [Spiroplasma cantharicola]